MLGEGVDEFHEPCDGGVKSQSFNVMGDGFDGGMQLLGHPFGLGGGVL